MIAQMTARLNAQASLNSVINTIMDDTVALVGSDFGDVQLLDEAECLLLVGQRGFTRDFLLGFRRLTKRATTACMMAAVSRQATVIENVDTDDRYVPYRDAAESAGYRSVLSVPLITEKQICVGVASMHFRYLHRPDVNEMAMLTEYSAVAASRINSLIANTRVSEAADQLFACMIYPAASTKAPETNVLAGNPGGRRARIGSRDYDS